jgi:S-adenosylmethionine synthetase
MVKHLFTSESVTEGHPDKLCDQISDGVLDALYKQDPQSRVAVETLTTTGLIVVAGEVTTKGYIDVQGVARDVIREAGYDDPAIGFDADQCAVVVALHAQSPDISQGVDEEKGEQQEQGAGDQGLMFGYACNETPTLMPLPIDLAHRLTKKLSDVRKSKEIPWIRTDGKSQVTIEYEDGKPKRADTILISTQHDESVIDSATNHVSQDAKNEIIEKVIKPICGEWIDENTTFLVNPTGRFVIGGPPGDSGLTGRKIIVDTYGGTGSHGGGCFSGKDPTKVDRSASYASRHIAKNIVAAELAEKCEIQLAYAIGVAEPVSVMVNTFGTGKVPDEKLVELVRKHFPLKPKDILEQLDLRRPIFRKTATYGHFGREDPDFTWEKTDKAEVLKQDAGL